MYAAYSRLVRSLAVFIGGLPFLGHPGDRTAHPGCGGRELSLIDQGAGGGDQDRQGMVLGVGVHAYDIAVFVRHDSHQRPRVLPLPGDTVRSLSAGASLG